MKTCSNLRREPYSRRCVVYSCLSLALVAHLSGMKPPSCGCSHHTHHVSRNQGTISVVCSIKAYIPWSAHDNSLTRKLCLRLLHYSVRSEVYHNPKSRYILRCLSQWSRWELSSLPQRVPPQSVSSSYEEYRLIFSCRLQGELLLQRYIALNSDLRIQYHGWSYNAKGDLVKAPKVSRLLIAQISCNRRDGFSLTMSSDLTRRQTWDFGNLIRRINFCSHKYYSTVV